MSKAIRIMVVTLLLGASIALSFGAGCTPSNSLPPNTDTSLDIVEEVWDIIFRDYVDRDKLDANALTEAAIIGMLEELDDPYTSYLDAETYQLALSSLEGKFEGIGAYVGVSDEQQIIVSPIPDSPADKAGIRTGDVILEINGESTSGMSLAETVLKIRGTKGTSVTLLILHQDETSPVEIEIVRDEIELPSVYSDIIEDIGYINIRLKLGLPKKA